MSTNNNLVKYCLQHMCSKEHIHNLFTEFGILFKQSDSYEKLVFKLDESKSSKIIIEKFGNQLP